MFVSKLDPWRYKRLILLVTPDTDLEELIGHVKRELDILFPMTKHRNMLFQMKQKSGQLLSDYYLYLKEASLDCNLEAMTKQTLVCHLLVRGLLPSEEKLRKKIVLGTEGLEIANMLAMSKISSHEMYRCSNMKRGEQVRRAGVYGGSQGVSRSRDPRGPKWSS